MNAVRNMAGNIHGAISITDMKIMRILLIVLVCGITTVNAADIRDSIPIYLQKGGKGLLDRDYYKALENYTLALRIDPANFEALRSIGVAYSGIGEPDLALENLEAAYKIDSLDAQLNNNLGAIYSDRKERTKSIKHFSLAIKADSTKPMFYVNLGQEYSRIGDVGKALPLLQKARLLAPNQPLTNYSIGNCYAASNSLDSAEHYYELSKKYGGSDWQLFYFLGSIKQKLGKNNEALDNYLEAVKLSPSCGECRHSLGLTYLRAEEYPEAIEQFKLALDSDSNNYNAMIGLGAAYSLGDSIDQSKLIMNQLFAVDSSLGFQMLNVITQEHRRRKNAPK